MTSNIYMHKWEVIREYGESLDNSNDLSGEFMHYTSIDTAFNILDSDSFWATNVRFSNDAMEERLLKIDNIIDRDDYVVCFCTKNDKLSQWRGYCHDGGMAINLDLNFTQEYSVLHADYETTGNYIIYENTPLPVLYMNHGFEQETVKRRLEVVIEKLKYDSEIRAEDMLPYLKNGHFNEEQEARLVFTNEKSNLSKCIRFRTLNDGVKVPYMVIKYGNMGKMKGKCPTDITEFTDDKFKEIAKSGDTVWIEEGYDQESKYFEMAKRLARFKKNNPRQQNLRILCKGKLPVVGITVAPTYDRERKAEQIRRFCQSKYWLRNVKVSISDIPFVKPNL